MLAQVGISDLLWYRRSDAYKNDFKIYRITIEQALLYGTKYWASD